MSGFFKSFTPILKKSKKYLLEIVLLTAALIITITTLVIYAKNSQEKTDQEIVTSNQSGQVLSGKIFVDVSGAVKKPNIYQIDFGARLKDTVDKAGGLSDEADTVFFNRNFNLARIITDQEKIYVPSIVEINSGVFVQDQRTLDYTTPTSTGIASNAPAEDNNQLINLNSATVEELDQLPGVGQTTANKIIKNRPYSTVEKLLTKKVVNKGVFEKIKNMITAD